MRGTTEQQQAVLNQVTVKAKELIEDLIRAQLESEETWTLKAKEAAVLAGITVLGKELLSGLLRLHETPYVPDTVPCRCSGQAEYQRRREGGVPDHCWHGKSETRLLPVSRLSSRVLPAG